MTPQDPATLIERSGDGWYFSFDTTPLPEYMVLTFRGRSIPARTETFLATIEENLPSLTKEDGHLHPTIVDLLAMPLPSLDDVKSAWAMVGGVTRRHTYMVFLVSQAYRASALFGTFLSVITRLVPNRYGVATSLEAAQAEIRAYHQRQK